MMCCCHLLCVKCVVSCCEPSVEKEDGGNEVITYSLSLLMVLMGSVYSGG